jgi:hypothetical protein
MNTSSDLLGYMVLSNGRASGKIKDEKEKGKKRRARGNGWYDDGGGLNERGRTGKNRDKGDNDGKEGSTTRKKKKGKEHHHEKKTNQLKIPFHSQSGLAWRKKPTNPIPIRIQKKTISLNHCQRVARKPKNNNRPGLTRSVLPSWHRVRTRAC